MVLDTSLVNTQQYKVRIKGEVEQSRERSRALSYTPSVVAIEKGAFWSPSTTVAIFLLIFLKRTRPLILVENVAAMGQNHKRNQTNSRRDIHNNCLYWNFLSERLLGATCMDTSLCNLSRTGTNYGDTDGRQRFERQSFLNTILCLTANCSQLLMATHYYPRLELPPWIYKVLTSGKENRFSLLEDPVLRW